MTRPIEQGYNGKLKGVKVNGEGESALASWVGKRVGMTISPAGLPLFPDDDDDAAEGDA